MELRDITLTINDWLGGMATFISSIFLRLLRVCFGKRLADLRLQLLSRSRNSGEAF
jgi:hypothetical protein